MIIAKLEVGADGGIGLTLTGHAGAAPRGEDLVCAGATTLAYTAAQAVLVLHQEGKLRHRPEIDISEGRAVVSAVPGPNGKQELEQALRVVWLGLEMLQCNYPGCIRLEGDNY